MRVFMGSACLAMTLGLLSCATPPVQIASRADYLAEATRSFPKETRERVIQAAEIVLRHGDNHKIDIRYVEAGFVADIDYSIALGAPAAGGVQRWMLGDVSRDGAQTASLSVFNRGTRHMGRMHIGYAGVMNSVPVFRLFWKRMDYLLGRRPDWVRCDDDIAPLRASQVDTSEFVGLCGHVIGDNDLPTPSPLPPFGKSGPAG